MVNSWAQYKEVEVVEEQRGCDYNVRFDRFKKLIYISHCTSIQIVPREAKYALNDTAKAQHSRKNEIIKHLYYWQSYWTGLNLRNRFKSLPVFLILYLLPPNHVAYPFIRKNIPHSTYAFSSENINVGHPVLAIMPNVPIILIYVELIMHLCSKVLARKRCTIHNHTF